MIAQLVEEVKIPRLYGIFLLGSLNITLALYHVFKDVIIVGKLVRYVVCNSIGRLWMSNTCHNDFKVVVAYGVVDNYFLSPLADVHFAASLPSFEYILAHLFRFVKT